MCLLDCEQSLFSLKICKREYLSSEVAWVARAQIRIRCSNTLAYTFSSKRETACSLYVFQCLQTFLLFSDRLNWRNNTTSNHEFSFKMSAWPCHWIDSGENIVQVWQTVRVLYFGARKHLIFIYLYIIFYTFVKLCRCQCIWDLKFEECWEVWPTEWHTFYRTHYINMNLSPLRCFPSHCLFQAMAWIYTLIQSHTCFIGLSQCNPCRCINWLTHQWKKLDLIKKSRCDQRKFLLIFILMRYCHF